MREPTGETRATLGTWGWNGRPEWTRTIDLLGVKESPVD